MVLPCSGQRGHSAEGVRGLPGASGIRVHTARSHWPAATAPPGEEEEPSPHDHDNAPGGGHRPTGPRPGAATRRRRADRCTRGYIRGGCCDGPGRRPGGRASSGRRASGSRRTSLGLPAPPVVVLTSDCLAVTRHTGQTVVGGAAEFARLVAGSLVTERMTPSRSRRGERRRCGHGTRRRSTQHQPRERGHQPRRSHHDGEPAELLHYRPVNASRLVQGCPLGSQAIR
jgi:hypothetical protein